MYFVNGLLNTPRGNDIIWVIDNRLTKSTHFILINISFSLQKLVKIYIRVIVKLHEVPLSIIYDRDHQSTSRFWESLQDALGTKLKLNSAYHPQTEGHTERTIQLLKDLLMAYILEQ